MKPKALLAVASSWFPTLFSREHWCRICELVDVMNAEPPVHPDREFLLKHLPGVEIVLTSWDTAFLNREILERADRLALLGHAAGTLKAIVDDAFWEREGVSAISSAAAIAPGVAEYTLGLMLSAGARSYWIGQQAASGLDRQARSIFGGQSGLYHQKIGIVGAGLVGREVIRLLAGFEAAVHVYDPYLSPEEAGRLGVTLHDDLLSLFEECRMVSLHAPVTEATRGMIGAAHLERLQDGAVLINTARAALLDQEALVNALRKGRWVACLDVTEPEPAPLDHPLRHLPNVWLTPHVAGGIGTNNLRIGKLICEELERYVNHEPLRYQVVREQLSRIG